MQRELTNQSMLHANPMCAVAPQAAVGQHPADRVLTLDILPCKCLG